MNSRWTGIFIAEGLVHEPSCAAQPELATPAQLAVSGVNGKPFALASQASPARIPAGGFPKATTDAAPVRVHGCQFRIVSESGQKPEAYRASWKDIAPISGGGFSEILVNFPHPAGLDAPCMAHCLILEHEDSGVMAQFTTA